jgi:hypothetical protein
MMFIGKIMIEVLVGLTLFDVSIHLLHIPMFLLAAVKGPDWVPPLILSAVLMVIPYFFAGFATYKAIQFIHPHLDLG